MSAQNALSCSLLMAVTALLMACTYTVDSTADAPDANPGDFICARAVPQGGFTTGDDAGLCTLRAAIMEANATVVPDRVEVPAGLYRLALPTLEGTELVISSDVLIRGAGSGSTIIDGGGEGCTLNPGEWRPVIRITSGTVGLVYLTIQNGNENGLRIEGGTIEIADSVVRENFSPTYQGGAINVSEGASLTVRRSSLVDNCNFGGYGGAIYNDGSLFVYDSLVADNNATVSSGAILSHGVMHLRNTTVSGNYVTAPELDGTGGIDQWGVGTLNNVTIAYNAGGVTSDGIGGLNTGSDDSTTLRNSIIAYNEGGGSGANDCAGALGSTSAYNLVSDSAGCEFEGSTASFLLDIDPLLAALADNGGPTLTHALPVGSPAREAASPSEPGGGAADACEAYDQRGVPRPQGAGVCDMGAFEAGALNAAVTSFVLVDADTNRAIRVIRNGESLNLAELPAGLSVRANVSGKVRSVSFTLDKDALFHTDNAAPFALGGDAAGDFVPVRLTEGIHTIRATPFSGTQGMGLGGRSLSVTFNVVQP
jgi:CSLREA domain-containing protein